MVFSFKRQVSLRMKFIADVMLGKLARYLRILGYDTIYFNQKDEGDLIKIAQEQGRTLLTRRARSKERKDIENLLFITEDNPREQLKEVLMYFHLSPFTHSLFTRCLICNERLKDMPREKVEGKVTEYILNSHDTFFLCPNCKRIYWPGSHHERMLREIVRLT
jgi:hypothetical protein